MALLQAHQQAVDPNLLQLSEAWAQAEAALRAQGKSTAALEAAAAAAEGAGEDEEEDAALAEAASEAGSGGGGVPEDLQVGALCGWVWFGLNSHRWNGGGRRQGVYCGEAALPGCACQGLRPVL